jgi:predicted nucleic acid-binding protein
MSDNRFVDTNIVMYAVDIDSAKGRIASKLLDQRPTMSTQVIMESVNVLIKKLGYTREEAFKHARFLLVNSLVIVIDRGTLLSSFNISIRYGYSHWDSLIIASALEAGCSVLYSEDLKDGQLIEKRLTIRNPFI